MRHGSLFSGIGGFDLAAEWMGWENVFQVEWDKYCQKVLAKNFPNVKRYGDIKEFDGTKYRGLVDIISGGFPCQPFSIAGKRKGKDDDRYLWPEYLRIIREAKPTFVTGENVPGIIELELDNIIADLEGEGYTTEQFIIPACAVNAPHRRDRIWIIANSNSEYSKKYIGRDKFRQAGRKVPFGRSIYEPLWDRNWIEVASEVCRVDDGIPAKLDRIKSLGNAIVPQVAYQIFKAIEEYENKIKPRKIN